MKSEQKSILLYLINNEKQTISSIASHIGNSVPTITKIVKEMVTEGYITPYECTETPRGRKPILYSANPNAFYFVGIDVRRYSIHAHIMNLIGDVLYQEDSEEFIFENTPEKLDFILNYINAFISSSKINREHLSMMCVNLTGRVDSEKGHCHTTFNFEGNDIPLAEYITQTIGVNTAICNDTHAMTYGELVFGAGRRMKNFLFLNAGWGIGLGMVIDGKLYTGKNGYAGEFGHINVYNNEIICHCGKKGCIETELSGQAIHRIFTQRIKNGETSILADKIKVGALVTTKDIVEAANVEDPLCLDIIEKVGSELGRQLANMINIFNPEGVIVGGNLSLADDFLLEPIRQGIRKYSLKLIHKDIEIDCTFNPKEIGVLGACAMARERFFSKFLWRD